MIDWHQFVLITTEKVYLYLLFRTRGNLQILQVMRTAAGADPAVGSKRREIMPEREEGDTEDRYKAKRMAFVRQALQHLTPEERIVLLTQQTLRS